MNFINIAQKANRSIGSSLLNLALLTGAVTTGNAASSYYSGRRGGYSSRNQCYMVGSGLGNLPENLPDVKNDPQIVKERLPTIPTELSLAKVVATRELVIVDRNVKDYHLFSQFEKPGIEVLEIPKEVDGLNFLLSKLSHYQGLSAVHLLSHGTSGELLLGKERVNSKMLKNNTKVFDVLNSAIVPGGDLLLYGCELAKNSEGENFIEIIKGKSHIDVAASDDQTGNMTFGGDWDLEIQKGDIEATPLAGSIALKDLTGVLQTTFSMNAGDVDNAGGFAGNGNNAQFNENGSTANHVLIVDGVSDGTSATMGYTYVGGGSPTYESEIILSLVGGGTFDPTSLLMYSSIPTTLTFTSDVSGSTSQAFNGSTELTISLSALAATTSSITITSTTNFSGRLDEVILDIAPVPTATPFLGLDVTNTGGSGFKTISNIPQMVTSNVMDISGTEIFPNAPGPTYPQVFSIKADGTNAESWNVSGLSISHFSGSKIYSSSSITFRDKDGMLLGTMSGTSTGLTSTPQDAAAYFGGVNFPISGVAQIEFSMESPANNNFTIHSITFSNPVAPPSNSAPTATAPTAPTVAEDASNVALANNFQVADIDGDAQTVTFTITGGILVIGSSGMTFGGGGNGSSNFTASGTMANINVNLGVSSFTATPNLNGTNAGTISFTTFDGTATSAPASVSFDISAVNDDPTIVTLPSDITVVQNTASEVDLSAATFDDVDAATNAVTLTIAATQGILAASSGGSVTIGGSGTATLTLTGTDGNIDTYLNTASNIQYTGPIALTGDNATTLTITANDGGNSGTGGGTNVTLGMVNVDITTTAPSSVLVSATVFLEGAWNGSTAMTTMLEDANLVAASAPYNGINTHAGSENVASEAAVPDGAVDWVLVELREAVAAATANNASRVGSAAGFLMSDGSIKSTDGTSDLTISLSGNSGADYFVVIYHRNHLPIMSAVDVDGSSGILTYDFTINSANTYQDATSLAALTGGKLGMIAGDANSDGAVNSTDLAPNWRTQNGSSFSYAGSSADFNLDGQVNAVDRNEYQQVNSGKTSQVPTN